MDTELILGILTILATNIFTFIKQRHESRLQNQSLQKKINETDALQSAKIEGIELQIKDLQNNGILRKLKQDLDFLTKNHQLTVCKKNFEQKVEDLTDRVLILKQIKNSEIKDTLLFGKEKSLKIFFSVIENEYKIDPIKFKERILLQLKVIKNNINKRKLMLINVDLFIDSLENSLKKATDDYVIDCQNLNNFIGIEKSAYFENISLKFIQSIYISTIEIYNVFLQNEIE